MTRHSVPITEQAVIRFILGLGFVMDDKRPDFYALFVFIASGHADQKKVVKIILQPGDVEELENLRMPIGYERRNVSYFVRKFRKIKVSGWLVFTWYQYRASTIGLSLLLLNTST